MNNDNFTANMYIKNDTIYFTRSMISQVYRKTTEVIDGWMSLLGELPEFPDGVGSYSLDAIIKLDGRMYDSGDIDEPLAAEWRSHWAVRCHLDKRRTSGLLVALRDEGGYISFAYDGIDVARCAKAANCASYEVEGFVAAPYDVALKVAKVHGVALLAEVLCGINIDIEALGRSDSSVAGLEARVAEPAPSMPLVQP